MAQLPNQKSPPPVTNSLLMNSPSPAFPSPTPSRKQVVAFKDLFFKRFGVDLNEAKALELATRYLHIFYFGVTPFPSQNPSEANSKSSPSVMQTGKSKSFVNQTPETVKHLFL